MLFVRLERRARADAPVNPFGAFAAAAAGPPPADPRTPRAQTRLGFLAASAPGAGAEVMSAAAAAVDPAVTPSAAVSPAEETALLAREWLREALGGGVAAPPAAERLAVTLLSGPCHRCVPPCGWFCFVRVPCLAHPSLNTGSWVSRRLG